MCRPSVPVPRPRYRPQMVGRPRCGLGGTGPPSPTADSLVRVLLKSSSANTPLATVHSVSPGILPTQIKSQITNFIGIEHPPKYFTFGAKLGNTLHTQLRVGMSKLNSHLFKIQNTILHPHCPCGHRTEGTLHFILHCPLYTEHRQVLMQNISNKLGEDFTHFTHTRQLETLLYGLHISAASGPGGGRSVSRLHNKNKSPD